MAVWFILNLIRKSKMEIPANNLKAIVAALQQAGYRGPFMFEGAGTPEEKAALWKQLGDSAWRKD